MCRTSRLVYQANAWSVLLTSYSCCYIFMSVVYVIPDTRSCCYAFGTWPSTLRPHVPSINYNYLERDGLVLPSLLAQDSPLLASLSSHSGRRKAARPSSLAICSARCLQFSVRRANLANCFCNVFGGPFAKNSRSGPRSSKRSSVSWPPVCQAKCKGFVRKIKDFRCVRCGRFGEFAEIAPRVAPSMESKM